MRFASAIRRAAASSKPKAKSAVVSVRTSGVFVTATPRSFAAARSTLSKPTPMLATIFRRGALSSTPRSILFATAVRIASAFAMRSSSASRGIGSAPSHCSTRRAGFSDLLPRLYEIADRHLLHRLERVHREGALLVVDHGDVAAENLLLLEDHFAGVDRVDRRALGRPLVERRVRRP